MPGIEIRHNNVLCNIVDPLPTEVLNAIDHKTKFHPAGYDHTWKFKHKQWDGYNHTFNVETRTFRYGLMDRVSKILVRHKYTVRYTNIAQQNDTPISIKLDDTGLTKHEFQTNVRTVVQNNKRGIIVSPTGSGKTVMCSYIIDQLQHRTLVVLNDLVLLDQMYRALSLRFPGTKIGYVGSSEFELADVTVATIQSLSSILGLQSKKQAKASMDKRGDLEEWLAGVNVIIHDEAHLADADMCVKFYEVAGNADHIYGFSATPYAVSATSNVELEQVFGVVIYSTLDHNFIDMGVKVPCIIKLVEVPYRMKTYGTWRDNQSVLYKQALKYEILENQAWIDAIVQQVREFTADNMSCFVYASHSLEYGHKVAEALEAPFVNGSTPRDERFRLFDALQNKSIMTLVSDIGGVGLDIPSLDVFILASDSKDIRQMRGRVERSCNAVGKKFGYFVDMYKTSSFLASHHDTRMQQYIKDGNIIT